MPTLNKLEYLDETKKQIKSALNTNFNSQITDDDTFRSYVSKIDNIYTNWPKVTNEGTEITLSNVKKGKMAISPKGNTEQTTYTGKNLLKINNGDRTSNGITGSYNDGVLSYSGKATGTFATITNDTNNILSAGNYTFSIDKPLNYRTRIRFTLNDDTTQDVTIIENTTSVQFTLTQSTKNNYIFVFNLTNGVSYNEEIKCMIEQGSSATNWEPYVGGVPSPNPDYPQNVKVVTGNNTIVVSDGTNTDNYSLNLGSLELCKIGDYQDYIYKENNKWYVHKEIIKEIWNGTEHWAFNNTFTDVTQFNHNLNATPTTTGDGYCNYFIVENSFENYQHIKLHNANTRAYLYIDNSIATDLTMLRTWLSTHNTEVYYVLETPSNTEITDTTLIEQLEGLLNTKSYDNQTNISSTYTSGNAQMIISVAALKKGGN